MGSTPGQMYTESVMFSRENLKPWDLQPPPNIVCYIFQCSSHPLLPTPVLLRSHQVSVKELLRLQVLHCFTDIFAHLQQLLSLEAVAHLPQVVQETAVSHVLSDDEDGALFGADSIQLHQLLMGKIPTRETGS